MIKRLLIANRGEIAVRIIRAAREMGVRTVAVYSDADRDAMHVALADEAKPLGAPEPTASYLNVEKIIQAAKESNAHAIHPGYGFLSERAEFAEACEKAGIIFVGPSSEAMRLLGSKIDAKEIAVKCGVPITPGFFEKGANNGQLKNAAEKIGFPVMLKASAGGGGRGMRVVRDPKDFERELALASEEALKAFGDGAMMVEKLIEKPRHVEVQVIADQHGNVACLFERECSLQRRHQKVVEEAPSVIGQKLWPDMREAVIKLVKAAGYTNAGTVEFMVDSKTGDFYFLEVNARLQVEHPVTEMITGLDLVQLQLKVASGEKLNLSAPIIEGNRSAINGHAIEARIVAEDPAKNFLPSIGKILAWAEPKAPGVRVDTGYATGAEISRYYDSLVAKVIAYAPTREQAINKLKAALLDFHVLGVKTNIPYLLDVLSNEKFKKGEIDTGFLEREFGSWSGETPVPNELEAVISRAATAQMKSCESQPAAAAWINDGFRN